MIFKRLGLFKFHDRDGIVDSYVEYLLDDVTKNLHDLIIVCNGPVNDSQVQKLNKYTDRVVIREDKGLDAGAFKAALHEYISHDELIQYDEIVFFNDEFYGPFYSFEHVFGEMSDRSVDFWGITGRRAYKAGQYDYIQTYFFAMRKSLIKSDAFKRFWAAIPGDIDSSEVLFAEYELYMTHFFSESGFTWDVLVNTSMHEDREADRYLGDHGIIDYILLKDYRCPVIKRMNFIYPAYKVNIGNNESTALAFDYICRNTNYDEKMIWDNLLRLYNVKELMDCLNLNFILPIETSFEQYTGPGDRVNALGQELPEKSADRLVQANLTDLQLPEGAADQQIQATAVDHQLPTGAADRQAQAGAVDHQLPTEAPDRQAQVKATDQQLSAKLSDRQVQATAGDQQLRATAVDQQIRAAVVVYLSNHQIIRECLEYISAIPDRVDVIIVLKSALLMGEINMLKARFPEKNIRAISAHTHECQASALLITCRDFLLEYDLLCFVHDEIAERNKSTADVMSLFHNMWHNTLHNPTYISNVINTFKKNPRLGFLTPPKPHHAYYFTFFFEPWGGNYEITAELAERLELRCNMTDKYGPASVSGAFWCRSTALKTLFEHDFTPADFYNDPIWAEGMLNQAVKFIYPYAAQHNGYYSGVLMSSEYAASELKNLNCFLEDITMALSDGTVYVGSSLQNILVSIQNMLDKNNEEVSEFSNSHKHVYLYGAGIVAQRVAKLFSQRGIPFEGFLVSDDFSVAEKEVYGYNVYTLEEVEQYKDECGIILAMSGRHYSKAEAKLRLYGFRNILGRRIV